MPHLLSHSEEGKPHNDLWSIDKSVVPFGKNNLSDVVLVQQMLEMLLTSSALDEDEATEAIDILTKPHPGSFVDAIYGNRTRRAVALLENRIGSPTKDGIIRPLLGVDPLGRLGMSPSAKMRKLNEIWDTLAIGGPLGSSKKETGRHVLWPGVFKEIYPGG